MYLLWRILNILFTRQDIGRGDSGGIYLTRWFILKWRVRIMLYWFHQSDNDVPHDHPWWYVSLILWGGYYEEVNGRRRWYGPGRILWRRAEHHHRIIVVEGRKPWTLIIAGKKSRE